MFRLAFVSNLVLSSVTKRRCRRRPTSTLAYLLPLQAAAAQGFEMSRMRVALLTLKRYRRVGSRRRRRLNLGKRLALLNCLLALIGGVSVQSGPAAAAAAPARSGPWPCFVTADSRLLRIRRYQSRASRVIANVFALAHPTLSRLWSNRLGPRVHLSSLNAYRNHEVLAVPRWQRVWQLRRIRLLY